MSLAWKGQLQNRYNYILLKWKWWSNNTHCLWCHGLFLFWCTLFTLLCVLLDDCKGNIIFIIRTVGICTDSNLRILGIVWFTPLIFPSKFQDAGSMSKRKGRRDFLLLLIIMQRLKRKCSRNLIIIARSFGVSRVRKNKVPSSLRSTWGEAFIKQKITSIIIAGCHYSSCNKATALKLHLCRSREHSLPPTDNLWMQLLCNMSIVYSTVWLSVSIEKQCLAIHFYDKCVIDGWWHKEKVYQYSGTHTWISIDAHSLS